MATHSSILAWKIPWTEEPGGLQSMGSQRVRYDWATSLRFTSALRGCCCPIIWFQAILLWGQRLGEGQWCRKNSSYPIPTITLIFLLLFPLCAEINPWGLKFCKFSLIWIFAQVTPSRFYSRLNGEELGIAITQSSGGWNIPKVPWHILLNPAIPTKIVSWMSN